MDSASRQTRQGEDAKSVAFLARIIDRHAQVLDARYGKPMHGIVDNRTGADGDFASPQISSTSGKRSCHVPVDCRDIPPADRFNQIRDSPGGRDKCTRQPHKTAEVMSLSCSVKPFDVVVGSKNFFPLDSFS